MPWSCWDSVDGGYSVLSALKSFRNGVCFDGLKGMLSAYWSMVCVLLFSDSA